MDRDLERKWFSPVALSFVLHFLFIGAAMWIRLPEVSDVPERLERRFHVKSVETDTRRFAAPRKIASTPGQVSAARAKDVPVGALVPGSDRFLRDSAETVPLAHSRVCPKPAQATNAATPSRLIRADEEKPLDMKTVIESLQKPFQNRMLHRPENVAMDPQEGMPGFTPSKHGSRGVAGFDFDRLVGEPAGAVAKYEPLDEFLDIEVYTYEDPLDLRRYYLIKIFAKKSRKHLWVMPKEILFTIDCSLSITPDRLEEFKKGIRYCLKHLNGRDVFNIVAFQDKAVFFSPRSVPATPRTIEKVEEFVAALTSKRRTDVYSAFDRIVRVSPGRRPSNVMLLSDGRPTHGIVDTRELLNSISRANSTVRPVFAFSGGARVNRYLLDFLSYQNRAWSEYVRRTRDIDTGLAAFYDKIKDPLFLNLRFQLSGLNEMEVFPKSLPDFYRNAEFTVYGAYTDEDKFSMQLLGDAGGKTKELIFTRSLREAKRGTADIMRGYAFNKIYHLISRMTQEGIDPVTLKEIEILSRRYGVTTPYSPEIQNSD